MYFLLYVDFTFTIHKVGEHCNQNDQEKFDHLPDYDFGKDDKSKWAIEVKICFYLNPRF